MTRSTYRAGASLFVGRVGKDNPRDIESRDFLELLSGSPGWLWELHLALERVPPRPRVIRGRREQSLHGSVDAIVVCHVSADNK